METLYLRREDPAWRHRSESPVIKVKTSPSGDNALTPRVTVVPRSVWAATEEGRTSVGPHFDTPDFDPDAEYFILLAPQHPGSENWPSTMRAFLFNHPTVGTMDDQMTMIELQVTFDCAVSLDEKRAALHRAEAFLNTSPTCCPGGLQGSSEFAADARRTRASFDHIEQMQASEVDTSRVRLTGLTGAAHLNGREGVILRADPNNSARVIVRLLSSNNEVRLQLTSMLSTLTSLLHTPSLRHLTALPPFPHVCIHR